MQTNTPRFKNPKILYHMAAKGLTQKQLAKLTGISRTRFSLIVNLQALPSASEVPLICECLGVAPEELEFELWFRRAWSDGNPLSTMDQRDSLGVRDV